MSDLDTLRWVMIPATFLDMFIGAVLPWKLSQFKEAVLYMSMGSCLATGIILGAAFSHMMPEADEAWNDYFEGNGDSDGSPYPFTPLICVGVLLLLVSFDTIAHAAHDKL